MFRNDSTRRRWLKTLGAAGGGSLLAGCGGNSGEGTADEPQATPPASTDRTFVTTEYNTIRNNNFNPYDTLYYPNQSPQHVFGRLFRINQKTDELIPELGTEMKRDGTTVTVELDDRFTWHDGDPVTSKDVLTRYRLDELTELQNWTRAFEAISAPDEYTVQIEVAENTNDDILRELVASTEVATKHEQYEQFLPEGGVDQSVEEMGSFERNTVKGELLSYTVTAPFGEGDQGDEAEVIGWGPWKLAERGERTMRMERYDDHPWADRFNFPEVKFEEYTTNQARYQALLSNNFSGVDLTVTQTVWDQIGDHYDNYFYELRIGNGWAFNYDLDWFKDHRVRQAFAYAMDKEEMVANSGGADEIYETHWMDTAFFGDEEEHARYFGDDFIDKCTQYNQDTERAASLLEAAGWSRDDGQWYDDDDERVSVTIRMPATWSQYVNMGQTAAQQLTEFGIDADFETQELVVYYGQTMIQRDYDIAHWFTGSAGRGIPWYAYKIIWQALDVIADTHGHPEEYEVPMPVGDPDGDTEPVNWQNLLTQAAQTRAGTDELRDIYRRIGWTYNQMLPVYCTYEASGVTWLDTRNWTWPDEDDPMTDVYYMLSAMNNHGSIKAL